MQISLLLKKELNSKSIWLAWLYPVIVGLGLLNVYFSDSALGAGIPMIMIIFPFCIIYSMFVENAFNLRLSCLLNNSFTSGLK